MTHHHKHASLANPSPGKTTTTTTGAAVASGDKDHNWVSTEAIRLCAYQKWESAGKPTGDGVQFWLEAEQELMEGKDVKVDQRRGWYEHREHERLEAEKAVKECNVRVDSHYKDNNRMFQSHGDRGHRHGGSG